MAYLTYVDGHRMALVPPGTVAEKGRHVEGHTGPRDVLVLPPEKELPLDAATGTLLQPRLHMARSNNLGGIFATVLLIVIVVTNVHLRGVWSLVMILLILLVSLLLALTGGWDLVLRFMSVVDVHINAFGYLCISTSLFVAWLFVFFFFDRLVYASFSRGQFRVHLAIGAGETAYEVLGMVVHKRRDDLFRHWILGFGSGDLTVKTGGANPQKVELPNVLFVSKKLQLAQQMLQEREVIKAQTP
jgi:FlaA1/EpsC-like NDP-sugar epimerase